MTEPRGPLHQCDECGRDFRSEDKWAVLCPRCDAIDKRAHEQAYASIGKVYTYERVKRGHWSD